MRSREQFDLQMQWLDKELERYNNYKKEAVIERFNDLRSVLKEEIKDLDLTIAYDPFGDELNFLSKKLNLDKDGFDVVVRSSIYKQNPTFIELINLIEDYTNYFDGLYDFSLQILN